MLPNITRQVGAALLISCACANAGWFGSDDEAVAMPTASDSLVAIGNTYLYRAHNDSAAAVFSRVVRSDSMAGGALVGLARVALARNDITGAERIFEHAERMCPDRGYGAYGRGLIAELDGDVKTSLDEFRRAYWDDRQNPEYSLAVGRAVQAEGISVRSGIRRRFERALRADTSYAPAILALGRFYENEGMYGKALEYYERYISTVPDDPEAVLDIALVLLERGRPTEGREFLARNMVRIPRSRASDALFIGAACHLAERHFEQAQAAFDLALSILDSTTRALHDDIRLVASPAEMETAELLLAEGVEYDEILSRFWLRRDATPATPINERLLEHHRRVWYAKHRFAAGRKPWDDRGEVYIRFGVPRHLRPRARRSTRPERSAVGTRYGGRVKLTTNVENWRYPQIGDRGLVVTFDDSYDTGDYRYTMPPSPTTGAFMALGYRWTEASIARVQNTVEHTPDRYEYGNSRQPLRFAYYPAQFRPDVHAALSDSSDVALCYGLPLSEVAFQPVPGSAGYEARVERGYAAFDDRWKLISRSYDHVVLESAHDTAWAPGALQPDEQVARLPTGGRIHLSVQARDLATDRLGAFQQTLEIERFDDEPDLSDIVLAGDIRAAVDGRRGLVRGDARILPLATRTFRRGQPIHVYFEIYNLTRGPNFGETMYEVEHSIVDEGSGSILDAVGRLLSGREDVAVGSVIQGLRETEPQRIALDTETLDPGAYRLVVTVADLQSGERASRERTFWVSE